MQNPIRPATRTLRRTRSLIGIGSSALLLLGIAGCASDVPLEPAADSNNPDCANLIVRLPSVVADMNIRHTNAQATSAWGEPANVLLYCGITPSGPTDLPCTTINGVDWIMDDSRAPLYRFEAYGRSPGLEIVIDTNGFVDSDAQIPVNPTNVLIDLETSAKRLTQERACTSTRDLNNIQNNG